MRGAVGDEQVDAGEQERLAERLELVRHHFDASEIVPILQMAQSDEEPVGGTSQLR